jgi:hypothetical protein
MDQVGTGIADSSCLIDIPICLDMRIARGKNAAARALPASM